LNSQQKYDRADIDGLDGSWINQRHKVVLRTGYTKSTTMFVSDTGREGAERKSKDYDLLDFGIPIVRKATQRLNFYEFNNLKRHLPQLISMREFITSERYLGKIKLEVSGLPEQIVNLSPDEQLDSAIQILETIAKLISSDKVEFKGTKLFKPYMLKDRFTDKTLNFAQDDDGDREFGRSMNNAAETAYHLDLSKRDWYVFDDCFGTSEEKQLIQFVNNRYGDLKQKYSDVYLIRNEKHFKLYNFDDGRPLEPDFVLYLSGKETQDTMHYQVFIEPKGSHLLKADEWKQNFLVSIKDNFEIEQLFVNKQYAVWGMPFYNSKQVSDFETSFNCVL